MENLHKFQQMQDEMTRFEAEISGGGAGLMQPVIGARNFQAMQQRLDTGPMPQYQQSGLTAMMFPQMPPPPPPPQMMMVPHQVQQLRPPSFPVHTGFPGPPSHHEFQPMHFQFNSLHGSQLIPAPTMPQSVVLSAKPKLYKLPKDEKKKEKHDKKRKRKAELLKSAQEPDPAPLLMPPPPSPPPPPASDTEVVFKPRKEKKNRKVVRTAGGQVWEDVTLLDWQEDDFRMFCGDLGNDVTDELLIRTFAKYASFIRARVVRDKRTNKSKGFGFVSFKDPGDFIKAMREMDGRYVGSRPIKLRKSTWKHRSLDVVRKKEKDKQALISLLMTTAKH